MTKIREKLENPQNLFLLGLIGLVLTYSLATRAIDTGSLGQYGLTLLFLVLSIKVLVKTVRNLKNGKQ